MYKILCLEIYLLLHWKENKMLLMLTKLSVLIIGENPTSTNFILKRKASILKNKLRIIFCFSPIAFIFDVEKFKILCRNLCRTLCRNLCCCSGICAGICAGIVVSVNIRPFMLTLTTKFYFKKKGFYA